eukprot:TRINITY_DN87_c0_g1_i1.p1 TRINITY_DN87_c0_g1~~TRINITY_DN87_c0_g1_i1.p1  ORF type:complete len:344 (-),score=75.13 TRINITY_DN87_c0_g1_i1:47-1078(-)
MVEKSYYEILNISKDADENTIKKAYHKLALKWHPDRNNSEEATSKFKEIGEAYEVLSDPEKRKLYDQFGKAGLGGEGMPSGGTYTSFSGGDPFKIFEQFFGGGMGGGSMGGGMGGNGFQSFSFGGPGGFSSRSSRGSPFGFGMDEDDYGMGGGRGQQGRTQPATKIDCNCTLEELYNGTVKKFNVTKNNYTQNPPSQEKKRLEINVKPGWKQGTKITFNQEGDIYPNSVPSDIVFTIKEKPHSYFTRDGNNLVFNATVNLDDALCGTSLTIPNLQGGSFPVNIDRVIHPNYIHRIPGAGMPISKTPGQYGDLLIKFNVNYPSSLNSQQKSEIRNTLSNVRRWG